jgi:hypothetical protein
MPGISEERNRREDSEVNRRSMNRSTCDPAGKIKKNNFDPPKYPRFSGIFFSILLYFYICKRVLFLLR